MTASKAKLALVTGAGLGIGRAIALKLAEAGCAIGVMDLEDDTVAETVGLIEKGGGTAYPLIADVTKPDQVAAAVARLSEQAGDIDVLVNNAGVARVGSLSEMSYEDWSVQFRVNVDGPFHCCQAVVPGMVARGYGRVINISSWFAKSGVPNYGGYCASKAAVLAFTRSLALEVASAGVTANAICPGTIVNTRMRDQVDERNRLTGNPTAKERESVIPLGRVGQPEDIAGVAAFLISPEAAYMTGQALNVTGGLWMS
jgi:NAD(P)-dependent dehydrogenase (short-subunit alcohol dehydrogenase family)